MRPRVPCRSLMLVTMPEAYRCSGSVRGTTRRGDGLWHRARTVQIILARPGSARWNSMDCRGGREWGPMDGLLASLVASHGWRPEPVATESLVHVLQRPEARAALGAWADALVPGLAAANLDYAGQVISGEAEGRPDVVGSTGSQARVVIEAKFAAPLTAAQTAGAYIGHLTVGAQGLLVYLVPSDRVAAMWSAASGIHAGAMVVGEPGPRRLTTVEGHVVTVLAWT